MTWTCSSWGRYTHELLCHQSDKQISLGKRGVTRSVGFCHRAQNSRTSLVLCKYLKLLEVFVEVSQMKSSILVSPAACFAEFCLLWRFSLSCDRYLGQLNVHNPSPHVLWQSVVWTAETLFFMWTSLVFLWVSLMHLAWWAHSGFQHTVHMFLCACLQPAAASFHVGLWSEKHGLEKSWFPSLNHSAV